MRGWGILFLFHISISAVAQDNFLVFCNVSDPHISIPAQANNWRMAKDNVKIFTSFTAIAPSVCRDLVVSTGDLIEDQCDSRNLPLARSLFEKIQLPWYVLAGNHDRRCEKDDGPSDWLRVFSGHGPTADSGLWSLEYGRYVLIGISSEKENVPVPPAVVQARQEWLRARLEAIPQGKRAIILLHHPLVVYNEYADKYHLGLDPDEARVGLRALIESYHDRVGVVISGHTHTRGYVYLNGIHHVSTPSFNSYPLEFTRFEFNDSGFSYENIPYADPAVVDEARINLSTPGNMWMQAFGSKELVEEYFSSGPKRLKNYWEQAPDAVRDSSALDAH